jgi:alpha-methylacyl-CoA racemase
MRSVKPLKGIRILSLALNLPGPAAVMRLRELGAQCIKLEPKAATGSISADPMAIYNSNAYEEMHSGVKIIQADLKTEIGQKILHQQLSKCDVLITSFRPSALKKLGINWNKLKKLYTDLIMISIVGAKGELAEEAGHDLTYLAQNNLINGLDMPPTLYADMGGSLLCAETVLSALMTRQQTGKGLFSEIALNAAAAYLALPRTWGLTAKNGDVGGAHAGYRIYPCRNGRVAVAALEPHFAKRLCEAAGLDEQTALEMHKTKTHQAIAAFFLEKTRAELNKLAAQKDIPLHTLSR